MNDREKVADGLMAGVPAHYKRPENPLVDAVLQERYHARWILGQVMMSALFQGGMVVISEATLRRLVEAGDPEAAAQMWPEG
ncbi:hypothetical protein [Telmatospirillum sp. J64-1]|uniref:hypothetical protein n=1 Tax=Telmatospirillum sp. J64-1 TaxID=2502183 RepID=UPI00115D9F4C|nr:hypothetical protein [Telmatospirillum sp. J64-1]